MNLLKQNDIKCHNLKPNELYSDNSYLVQSLYRSFTINNLYFSSKFVDRPCY